MVLKIQDHGCGIEESELPTLFEPFIRSSGTRRRVIDGIGLGLSIVKRLSKVLQCDLTVKSRPGEGSCFMIQFPLVKSLDVNGA